MEGFIMARIKIKDLPNDQKISKEEMKKILGGATNRPKEPKMVELGWYEIGGATHKDSWKGE